jgi:hypothetical protein
MKLLLKNIMNSCRQSETANWAFDGTIKIHFEIECIGDYQPVNFPICAFNNTVATKTFLLSSIIDERYKTNSSFFYPGLIRLIRYQINQAIVEFDDQIEKCFYNVALGHPSTNDAIDFSVSYWK